MAGRFTAMRTKLQSAAGFSVPPPPTQDGKAQSLPPPPPMADAAAASPVDSQPVDEAALLAGMAQAMQEASAPKPAAQPRTEEPARDANSPAARKWLDAKVRLHHKLLEDMNLSAMDRLPVEEIKPQIAQVVSAYVVEERLALTARELDKFVDEIIDEMIGLGPLEPLLRDPSIADILINGHECVFVERKGQLEPRTCSFATKLISCASSTVSCRPSAAALMNRSHFATRAFSTAPAST